MTTAHTTVFGSVGEDFVKICLITIAVPVAYFIFGSSPTFLLWLFLFTVFVDAGHVYSTYAETLWDSSERRKTENMKMIAWAFVLNYSVFVFAENLFLYYIFYFTVYHNMRQGLGVSLLYKAENVPAFKRTYYAITLIPFVIFHFLESKNDHQGTSFRLDEGIVKAFNFHGSVPDTVINAAIIAYFIFFAAVTIKAATSQNRRGALSAMFFGLVYSWGFIFSKDPILSYAVLVISHAMPYLFLMERRILMTHSSPFARRHSYIVVIAFFVLGGMMQQLDEMNLFGNGGKYLIPLFFTPVIGHFLLDSIMWTKDNEKMRAMKLGRDAG